MVFKRNLWNISINIIIVVQHWEQGEKSHNAFSFRPPYSVIAIIYSAENAPSFACIRNIGIRPLLLLKGCLINAIDSHDDIDEYDEKEATCKY